jgi:DNA processing protein
MNEELLVSHIALSLIPQIGDTHISALLKHFDSPDQIFRSSMKELECISGIGSIRALQIKQFKDFDEAKKELEFSVNSNIQVLVKGCRTYPQRLENCIDAPHILYYKGSADLNVNKIVSIVGTRAPTDYGRQRTIELVQSLATQSILIVSGLAYGIDTIAHKESLRMDMATVAVLGHGLQHLYPHANKSLSFEMLQQGGLLTEFLHGKKPDKQNFPRRNRVVAGIADVVVVIESGEKGGSLITADIANSYNKDVLTYPGRSTDLQSTGCNQLIRGHKANLITSGQELIQFMNWEPVKPPQRTIQPELFINLEDNEKIIYEFIRDKQPVSIDEILVSSTMKPSIIPSIILSLEMKSLIFSFPGKFYKTASR